jgi:hypothetical protein
MQRIQSLPWRHIALWAALIGLSIYGTLTSAVRG